MNYSIRLPIGGNMSRNSYFASAVLLIAILLAACSRVDIAEAEEAMRVGNYAEAYYLWRQLAEQGHPIAMYNIGWMYHNGYGLVIDDEKAAQWWRNAAESGLEDAEMALGMLYYYGGKGIPRDLEKSAEYLMPGAARGDEEAALLLETFIGKLDPEMRERFAQLIEEAVEEQAQGLEGKPLRITANRANLRAEPTTRARVVKTLTQGAVVGELERVPDWVKVQFAPDEAAAWIHSSLVREPE